MYQIFFIHSFVNGHLGCFHVLVFVQLCSCGTPLQYCCLENPMDGGAWWAAVHGVSKSQTWLSNFTFTFHFHALEKEMATHSSVLAWRIPWSEKPGGLQSMGSHRVGHDWSDLAAAAAVVNIGVNVAFWIRVFVFSGCMLRSGIAGSYGNLVSYGTSMLFSVVTAPIYILTKSVGVFPFLHILSSIYYL